MSAARMSVTSIVAAVACAGRAPGPTAPARAPAITGPPGELRLAAGGAIAIDQAFVWATWDPDEHVWWITAFLQRGRARPLRCANVWRLDELERAAPFTLLVYSKDLGADAPEDGEAPESPETVAGWQAGAVATGRRALAPGGDFHVGKVTVQARRGDRWTIGLQLAKHSYGADDVLLAEGRFDARWCGVVAGAMHRVDD